MSFAPDNLPNLLYLGDVPVESSYHGSALLYRLLENYPADKLRIVETDLHGSLAARRLAGVTYAHSPPWIVGWLNTRFHRWVSTALLLSAARRTRAVPNSLGGFETEAVLTVAHGYSWITAAAFAQIRGLPLHLIIHDDFARMANVFGSIKTRLDASFGQIYRQASSRFCVSPYMRDYYRERYGADGSVLYPSRATDCPIYTRPAERLFNEAAGLTIAFAGTINSGGFARLLGNLAECLERRSGSLLLFGPHTKAALSVSGLNQNNIRCEGLIGSNELIQRLRRDVDVLFVPMSFEGGGHQYNMRLSFPSKLTDYTAVGLPLLICGPDYCSAVKWAQEQQPVAEVVTSDRAEALEQALQRLDSPEHRRLLATRALEIGNRMFAQTVGEKTFFAALRAGMETSRA